MLSTEHHQWVGTVSDTLPRDDGYRGIWYYNQPSGDQYRYKYSGGLGTYPQQITPFAHYAPEVDRTFFCYGGTAEGENRLLHMVSYYDHASRTVPRPAILLDKATEDAHDNPALMLDGEGHIWVFSNAHGRSRPAFIHRSVEPWAIDRFEQVAETNFSYSQPWWLPGRGFLFLHTLYAGPEEGGPPRRRLFWSTIDAEGDRSEARQLAGVELGNYQVSWRAGSKVGTAFNYHPEPVGLNARTNLYYLETDDTGRTWRNAAGEAVKTPLRRPENPALVHDYRSDGLLVYLKNVQFDRRGRPILLFLTSRGYASGPENDPRAWRTARWTGEEWEILPVTQSDNNYDYGPLYVEPDGTWRLIAPTATGPQPYNPGGEVAIRVSEDRGRSWREVKRLTADSERNHTYVRRPVNAHPDFYALWADGNARESSESRLYFTDREGSRAWRLPARMAGEVADPEPMATNV